MDTKFAFAFAVPLESKISCIDRILDCVRFSTIMAVKDITHFADADSGKYVFLFEPFFKMNSSDIEDYRQYLQNKINPILEVYDASAISIKPNAAS